MSQSLQEENRLLVLMSEDDAKEIRRLKDLLDLSGAEKSKLQRRIDEQEAFIRAQDKRIYELEQKKFDQEVNARTVARQEADLKDVDEERQLLTQQANIDAETIRSLQTQLHEALYERDRLAGTIDKAKEDRDTFEEECALLSAHSDELRRSNVELASKVADLQEQVTKFEEEDYAQWFTRKSKKEISAARTASGGGSGGVGSQRSSFSGAPLPPVVASTGQQALTSPRKVLEHEPMAESASSPTRKQQPAVHYQHTEHHHNHHTTAKSTTTNNTNSLPTQSSSSSSSYLVVRDALSGMVVPGSTDDDMMLAMSPTKYSDSDDESRPATCHDHSPTSMSHARDSGASVPIAATSPARGAPFKTVKQSRRKDTNTATASDADGPSVNTSVDMTASPTSLHQQPTNTNNMFDPSRFATIRSPDGVKRPQTTPLVVEAIYGEKCSDGNGEKMYLVKFVSVESEQWTSAAFVDSDCEALKLWKRSKARDRRQVY